MISDRWMVHAFNSQIPDAAAGTPLGSLQSNQPRTEGVERVRRKHLSTTERLELLEREKHICHLCKGAIQPGQAWDVSHEIPVWVVGHDDDADNRRAAHRKCHRDRTAAVDQPAIAKTKRIRAKYRGANVSQFPMRGGRRDALKKRMDGTVVLRATGRPWQPRRANR